MSEVEGKEAITPCVGIVYLVGRKLWIDASPLARAGNFGGFAIHERDHILYWEELVKSGRLPESDYGEHPRGRVAYNTKTGNFLFLADACILRRKGLVKAILRRLHLPRKSAEIICGSDYRCFRCIRRESLSC